jgi:hypothetical protein
MEADFDEMNAPTAITRKMIFANVCNAFAPNFQNCQNLPKPVMAADSLTNCHNCHNTLGYGSWQSGGILTP